MAEITNLDDENDLYQLPEQDLLAILTSTKLVVEEGELVWVDAAHIEQLCDRWSKEPVEQPIFSPQWYEQYHFHDGTERSVNWILLLDALNFCFWAEKDQPRWTIDYRGETLNGYLAEAAALKRAVEEGFPLWDATFLSQIDEATIAHIFRGKGTIPLFAQRVHNAREVGNVLREQYDGQFIHAIEQVQNDAIGLVRLLAQQFPSFYDVETYRKQNIFFYKRAQICVADLFNAFSGKTWGAFTNLDQLTIFADYKLPQVLRHSKILEYAPELAEKVDNQELIPAGSEEEIEIRAATVWACELLRQAMERRGQRLTASEIDLRLWFAGQKAGEMRPYHRTRTFFY